MACALANLAGFRDRLPTSWHDNKIRSAQFMVVVIKATELAVAGTRPSPPSGPCHIGSLKP